MKLVKLDYEQPCDRYNFVVVEVPDDYPENKVAALLTDEQVTSRMEADSEVHETGPAKCTDFNEIGDDDGPPNFRLTDGKLVQV